jgi:hypothetical protein
VRGPGYEGPASLSAPTAGCVQADPVFPAEFCCPVGTDCCINCTVQCILYGIQSLSVSPLGTREKPCSVVMRDGPQSFMIVTAATALILSEGSELNFPQ